ncbi:hypothetical protein Phi4:1_gp180 [Cellulophaga phage phi4:1]|uniref:Uncharacterized protein n=3 Tax=Lightbulbvirus Cba41 TaxID=1918524 RepID=A0A0S2MWZ4_9CAUD|nr:hypothetical protein Phi4:1_gp180 [Cellulophaga phage phi4:1]AGO49593.1 hypothetical protein Phi4:1_gp180 [Cellulophaga phage phi4:1]ALO80189.1 hypothetical protein Phi4113_180 [Cellulophaga phage phi4:1_13]ALO80386.1 hypothetical protein Phi4118_180 [Cellulophaga phage phi4:1_18]
MKEFNTKIQKQLDKISKGGKLFRVELTGEEIWSLYLNSFEKGDDPVFRDPESTVHNCNHCNNFVRRYGNVVAINKDMEIESIFDVDIEGEFKPVAAAMAKAIRNSKINNVFIETFQNLKEAPYEKCTKNNEVFLLGVDKNAKAYTELEAKKFGVVKAGDVKLFNHLHMTLDKSFVDMSGKSEASILANYRSSKEVFERAMEEISLDTLTLVKELINQGSLLNGDAFLHKIKSISSKKKAYDLAKRFSPSSLNNWCWDRSYGYDLAKFRNELIGVLCTEITEGKDLTKACLAWNKRVDPANFMLAVAPITETQKKNAKKFAEENGYLDSFDREFAKLDDILVDEIQHINSGDGTIKVASVFDKVKTPSTQHKRSEFKNIPEVGIDKFMADILPGCTSVEVFLENKHERNLVTMTTSKNKGCKPMFKWDNPYSWTYKGNLAGVSLIKEAIKSRGGDTTGCLNIRMAFPDTTNDYDLHMKEPTKNLIYYNNVRQRHSSSGMLDLDAQGVDGNQTPENRVENINYQDINSMPEGIYTVSVEDYSGGKFPANCYLEVEFGGETTSLVIEAKNTKNNSVEVCQIILKNGEFTIKPSDKVVLTGSESLTKNVYGLDTNKFHKVNLMCLSPNYWSNNEVGFKHFFFMLDKCKTDTAIKSFHTENLNQDLVPHRKVLDVLSATTMIEPKGAQLSGLGFNATVRDEVVLKLSGSFKRTIKVKF